MNLFFDTSALVKYFHEEIASDFVLKLITDNSNSIWISSLAEIELLSAIYRRFRNNEIDEKSCQTAIQGVQNEVSKFNVESLNNLVIDECKNIMKSQGALYGLRTLDALHIASFCIIADKNWKMVTADTLMQKVTEELGYTVLNPISKN